MSTFSVEQRPTMRRKSSAQNLLSSFKSSSASSTSTSAVPPPLNLSSVSVMNSTAMSFSSAATPTATTPLQRVEWDAQSLHSETVSSSLAGAQSPPLGQGTSIDLLRELVQKRIATLTYVRTIHEGRSHWFHTIQISRAELDKVFNNNNISIKKRTNRFAILGLSLSTLLDIHQPFDLLRGLMNIITEYDQSKEEGDNKSRIRIFKSKGGKKATGIPEFTGSYVDNSPDASFLLSPSIPFPLDYHQTLLSLLDVLSEVYNKISKILGPSPFPNSQLQTMGPLGPLASQPGVSYLFPPENTPSIQQGGYSAANQQSNPNLPQFPLNPSNGQASSPDSEISGSLWEIANPSPGSSGTLMGTGSIGSLPPAGSMNSLLDSIVKIDSKLKKITATLLKELDDIARAGIKDELASLDPLLRNISNGVGAGQFPYDFEGM